MLETLSIESAVIGPKNPPYIIAELSANHCGSLELALQSITAAKMAGAHAVKLQTYTPDTMTIDCDKGDFVVKDGIWRGEKLYELYRRAYTPFEWHKILFDHARSIGITIFSTPYDETAVDLLASLDAPAYKIASFENIDLDLIRYVSKLGKPVIISTGMASEWEIKEAINEVFKAKNNQLAILHCVSSYPLSIENSNLQKIQRLKERFGVAVGFSDHTTDNIAAITSIAFGAVIIEKHFTLNHCKESPDDSFSLDSDNFRSFCTQIEKSWRAIGTGTFELSPAELSNKALRRSIYFVKDLCAGSVVTSSDIRRIRPGYGLAPKHFSQLIGRRMRVNVSRGTAVEWEHFL
jgi:pseudaminic acid synthase